MTDAILFIREIVTVIKSVAMLRNIDAYLLFNALIFVGLTFNAQQYSVVGRIVHVAVVVAVVTDAEENAVALRYIQLLFNFSFLAD